jgi:hypothetical protein
VSTTFLPRYAKTAEAAQILGMKTRELYWRVERGHIAGVERWGTEGVTERGNRRKGRLRFVRAELAYIGPRMSVAQNTSEIDPDDPANWDRLS